MMLTVFYVAATWMQVWRINSIKKKLVQFINQQKCFELYKVPPDKEGDLNILSIPSVSSTFCKNKSAVVIDDLLFFTPGIRTSTVLPQQIINLDNWIHFSTDYPLFLKTCDSSESTLTEPHLYFLMESSSLDTKASFEFPSLDICEYGKPKAWKIEDTLGIVVESDVTHLSSLASKFMTQQIHIGRGFEIVRLETVLVEGKSCQICSTKQNNVNDTPHKSMESIASCNNILDDSRSMISLTISPSDWETYTSTLRRISECAEKITDKQQVPVPGLECCTIRRQGKDAEPVSDVPEDEDEEVMMIISEKAVIEQVEEEKNYDLSVKCSYSVALSTPPTSTPVHSVSSQSTPVKHHQRKNTFTSLHSVNSASTMSVRSMSSARMKPPNVLVYCESPVTTESIKTVLHETLHNHKYTIYSVTGDQLVSSTWSVNCAMLVVCGNLPEHIEPLLTTYLLQGGRLFCLCSSFLHTLLPTFRTAEVRERELVRFSYGKWNRVRLMHHVFCYQNSPIRTRFSREADDPPGERDRVSPVPQTPSSVEVQDQEGKTHTLHVVVLGAEETWQTPSLLLAYFPSPAGRVVFSQVHLELDPNQSCEEREGEALRNCDNARKEIIRDLLSTHLGLECNPIAASGPHGNTSNVTPGYFLGRHELKQEFLEKIKYKKEDGLLRVGNLSLKFCGKGETPPPAKQNLIPVLIHACPRDFSTLEYYENLKTETIGRLLIYCEIVNSTMDVLGGELCHGLAVVASQQTSGRGRGNNQWLSPPGCVMFSLQLHFPIDSYLGQHASILQIVAVVAVVSALSDVSPQYAQALDLRLKWPNDIYTGDMVKIGGLIATCTVNTSNIVCNVGCGINLNNDSPTTCLNTLISDYNKTFNQKLSKLSREMLLALVFTKIEEIIDRLQEGDVLYLHTLYHHYWLHSNAEVNVMDGKGNKQSVIIVGIDEFGYLRVRESTGQVFTVHPDGNSFDMLEGLIAPKLI